MTVWIVFIYACLILIGGIIGYIKAASAASLIMGLFFSTMLLLSSYLIFRKKRIGLIIALALTAFLDCFFTYRFIEKVKFFPSGLLSILSLGMLVVLVLKIRKKR